MNQSGTRLLVAAIELQDQRLPRHGRGDGAAERRAGAGRLPRHRRLGRARRRGRARSTPTRSTCGCGPSSRATRSTSSTPRAPPAAPRARPCRHRNILNNGYFTTELIDFTEQDRLCIPVPFYHCFGMVMANLGCTSHGTTMVIPAPGFDPGLTLDAISQERCTARVRRADDVHRDAAPPVVRRPRPRRLRPAHRDHGRLDLPGRGDEALRQRDAAWRPPRSPTG